MPFGKQLNINLKRMCKCKNWPSCFHGFARATCKVCENGIEVDLMTIMPEKDSRFEAGDFVHKSCLTKLKNETHS